MKNWINTVIEYINKSENIVVKLDFEKKTINYSDKIKKYWDIQTISGSEEIVRAYLIQHLVNDLSYKPELIEIEKEYNIGRPKVKKARIDVIVLNDTDNNPFFFIEVKAPDKFESDKQYIEGQLFQLAKLEKGKISYLVYYTIDEIEGKIIDKAIIIDYQKYKEYSDWEKDGYPTIADELPIGYNKPRKIPYCKNGKNCGKRDLVTKIDKDDILSLTTDLHNVLWGGGSTGDTEIFYSLVNIILAKIQDESEKTDGQEYDFQIYQYVDNESTEFENAEKVFERLNKIYKRSLRNKLFISDEQEISDANIISRQKFPLNKLVYTVQKLEKYSFVEGKNSLDGKDILGEFFETITRDGFKQTKGQFFTPINIVKFMIYALQIDKLAISKLNQDRELPYIIDPSLGSATFLVEAMKAITKELKYKQNEKIVSSREVQDRYYELFKPDHRENRWAREYLYGVEHNFDLGTASKVNMILHGDGSINIFIKDGLLPFRFYNKIGNNELSKSYTDNLYYDKEINGHFDAIISNPPFSVNLDNETKRYLNKGFLFAEKASSENLFIERYYQLLKENGRLAIVLPEKIFDTADNRHIRVFLFKYFNIRAVVSLPQTAFEPYTSQKTSLLFAQKKSADEIKSWQQLWDKFSKEWSLLKTRVENYVRVYLKNEDKNKFSTVKDDTETNIKENILRFLKDYTDENDKNLKIVEILTKYEKELKEISTFQKDTKEIFGFCNIHWVFSEITKNINYSILLAETENIGYKRSKRGELITQNDLFDIEIAPKTLDKNRIILQYDNEIRLIKERLEKIQSEITDLVNENEKKLAKQIETLNKDNENLLKQIENLNKEKEQINLFIDTYYQNNQLKEKYYDRTEEELLSFFTTGLLKNYKSEDVLLRKKIANTILDELRKNIDWENKASNINETELQKCFALSLQKIKENTNLFLTTRIKDYAKNADNKLNNKPFDYFVDNSHKFTIGQIKTHEYLEKSDIVNIPVIDQSQNYIAGYTDKIDCIYTGDLPIIVFGDHTRVFKFIDFPFVQGADGIKIIKPNQNIVNPKFFYYLLKYISVPSRGYNRHFSILKTQLYPEIDMELQNKIVETIETIENEIEKLKIQISYKQINIDKIIMQLIENK